MNDPQTSPPPARSTKLGPAAVVVVAVAAAAFAFWLYGKAKPGGNSGQVASCTNATRVAQAIAPLARGEVAALQVRTRPQPAPEVSFKAPDGRDLSLADFRGRTILLNLWATWCAPCRHEMPALDRLQQRLGGPDFEVVAINIDTTRLERPKQFLDEAGVSALANYADHSAQVFQSLKKAGKAFGMPTTLLIDGEGCELANLAGPADWASGDALALVRAALSRP